MRHLTCSIGFAIAAVASLPALAAGAHYKGEELATTARVTLTQARTIALKARPGRITDQELERESGGSGLRFSFDITHNHKPFEVGVDARTGAVLENTKERPNAD